MSAFANFRDTILCLSLLGLIERADNRDSYIDNRCLRDSYRVDLCKTHLLSTCLRPWFGVPCLSRYCGEVLEVSFLASRGAMKVFFFRQHVVCRSLSLSSSNFIAHCCASEYTPFRAVHFFFFDRRSDAMINSQRGPRPSRVTLAQHFLGEEDSCDTCLSVGQFLLARMLRISRICVI